MTPDNDELPADLQFENGLYTDSAFNGATAIILMPTYAFIEPETKESLWMAASKFGREKLRYMSKEKTCVWVARNILIDRFLKTDANYALMLDSDVGLPCGNAAYYRARFRCPMVPDYIASQNFFTRLLSHPPEYGIVGASYFDRQVGTQLQCSRGCGSNEEVGFNDRYRSGAVRGLVECLWVATGGMRIARWVLEKILEEKRLFPEAIPPKSSSPFGFFTPARVGQGEDVAFCVRAARLGIKSYLDADLRLMHKGSCFY